MIKKLIENGSAGLKNNINLLMQGNIIKVLINEHIVYNDLSNNQDAIWSLLLLTGYLKAISAKVKGQKQACELAIPNIEIAEFYQETVEESMSAKLGTE